MCTALHNNISTYKIHLELGGWKGPMRSQAIESNGLMYGFFEIITVWLFLKVVLLTGMAILNKFVNVFSKVLPKGLSLIREYVLFVPMCPWKIHESPRMVELGIWELLKLQRMHCHTILFHIKFHLLWSIYCIPREYVECGIYVYNLHLVSAEFWCHVSQYYL